MSDLQDITNLEHQVRRVVGLETFTALKTTKSISKRVSIVTDFLIENYSFFFEKEDTMEDLATDLDILTDINDGDYELTDEIVNSVMDINHLVEVDNMEVEVENNIKVLLVYTLEILQEV